MNQTKKRLSIINYAISITDIETIQLQVLKLGMLKTDEKIQTIIRAIQAENYAQAQRLIAEYIEAPTENVLQRSSQEKTKPFDDETQAIIDEFNLFVTPAPDKTVQTVDINDFLTDMPHVQTKPHQPIDFDTLLQIEAREVLPDALVLETASNAIDTFFEAPVQNSEPDTSNSDITQDPFFETETTEVQIADLQDPLEETPLPKETIAIEIPSDVLITKKEKKVEKDVMPEADVLPENDIFSQNHLFKELKPKTNVQSKIANSLYKAIPYIAQKISSMTKQYPTTDSTQDDFESAKTLLSKISQESYNEKEIEETLTHIKQLTEQQHYAEAAQLLLICAATESKFSQFMLARELYKGVLFEKNIPESFAHMTLLAAEDYPEALCDLAQFYEHGIGTKRDKKKAEQLYFEAMEAGVVRAEKHYNRLKKDNKSFLDF